MANEISLVVRAKFVKNFKRKEHGKFMLRSTRLCGRLGTQLNSRGSKNETKTVEVSRAVKLIKLRKCASALAGT